MKTNGGLQTLKDWFAELIDHLRYINTQTLAELITYQKT